jgi:UDP-N-acetylmuramoyl-tripeptide--D-alanyl-D-alanine ligase
MDAKEVAKVTEGRLVGNNRRITGVHFDSREIKEGNLFVPVKGKRDGHLFISDAFSKGAAAALTEKELNAELAPCQVVVKDALEAFKKIALYRRGKFQGPVVAVTGSVGKTTTKELLKELLPSAFANPKSYNNLLGVCYTLSNLPEGGTLIQEVGTNSPGEVKELRELIKPTVAVVTAVGKAHTQGFGSLKEVAREKLSLTEGADLAIVPWEYRQLSRAKRTLTFGEGGDAKLKELTVENGRTAFTVEISGKTVSFQTEVPGKGLANATLIALLIAELFGIPLKEVKETVENFSPPERRMAVLELPKGRIIDDCYNANPLSMENATLVLKSFKGEKVAVIGEMLELGEESKKEHEKLAKLLEEAGANVLIAFGKETKITAESFKGKAFHFTDRKEFINFIEKFPFEGKTVLVKGSRGNRLEEAVEIVKKRLK